MGHRCENSFPACAVHACLLRGALMIRDPAAQGPISRSGMWATPGSLAFSAGPGFTEWPV